jgi:hypothetical protein
MRKDPNEWNNLAKSAEHEEVIKKHRAMMPKSSRMPAKGSHSRILTYDPEGKTIWEGKEIEPGTAIPEL